jgi:excisionase family DNA binding protein
MTIEQLAEYLSISKWTIYRWINRREIPFIAVGRIRRFDPASIDEWMKKKTIKTTREVLNGSHEA